MYLGFMITIEIGIEKTRAQRKYILKPRIIL